MVVALLNGLFDFTRKYVPTKNIAKNGIKKYSCLISKSWEGSSRNKLKMCPYEKNNTTYNETKIADFLLCFKISFKITHITNPMKRITIMGKIIPSKVNK